MNHKLPSLTTTDLVISDGGLCTFKKINDNEEEIDESYLQLLADNGISENDISQFLKKTGLSKINEVQFSDEDEDDEDVFSAMMMKKMIMMMKNHIIPKVFLSGLMTQIHLQSWSQIMKEFRNGEALKKTR